MTNISDVLEPRESSVFASSVLLLTHRYDVRAACPTWHPGASWEEQGGNMSE
ncbi:hypothetical protein L226DRAFT_231286 [Lentinus tigrinus ALCF2SS1-7]|uniref:uncharacterized protein n=1 Tax=Lentinus tigrinus ALCF2SS1-7 TaxID=1328758 RepID=UPI0011663DDA|nr:hypothetical protein L226DRAFT_231286 [Lentinus tigrinus ALCF2SS1-7]